MRNYATKEQHDIWKERYLNGETARNIAKDFPQFHESTISRYIKNLGISRGKGNLPKYIKLKPQILIEYQEDKFATCSSLSRKYNINDRTISAWLQENNIPIKQTQGFFLSKANQEYFENIDTPSKAYLLGFITADGAITGKPGHPASSCSIEIHEKDRGLIEFAKQEINPEASITECHYRNKNNVKVSFNGIKLCQHLNKYGIVKNKSKIIKKVPFDLIPKELLCYYFRGLIDGDGCIGTTGKVSIYSGSEDFIKSVQEILCNEIGLTKLKIYHGTTYFISWSSKIDRQRIYNYLYKDKLDQAYYYERKYKRLYDSLYANTEVIS